MDSWTIFGWAPDPQTWTIMGWAMAGLLGFCVGILIERYIRFKGPKA